MNAVMSAENDLGNKPEDISSQKVGYDILSYDPNTNKHRFIEVKGREVKELKLLQLPETK